MLGIEDVLDRYPGQLSGGERQRVAMGRAISRRPSVFLMDEPLSNLDAKLRNHLRAEMPQLTRELGVTTVYVTHDQAEAMSLGDRVAVMRGGRAPAGRAPRARSTPCRRTSSSPRSSAPRASTSPGLVHAPLDGAMSIDLGKPAAAAARTARPWTTSCSGSSRAARSSSACARRRPGSPRRARPAPARWRSAASSSTWSTRGTRHWSTSTPARSPPWCPTWRRRVPTGPPSGAAAPPVAAESAVVPVVGWAYWSG